MATEQPIDVECYVGTYEIWPAARVPEKDRPGEKDLAMPYLVQIGRTKLITPQREAMDMAVTLLQKTKLPKLKWEISRKQHLELQAEEIRHGRANWERLGKEISGSPAPADFADIEKSALKIASQLGMLTLLGVRCRAERLEKWVQLADVIQAMYSGHRARRGLPKDLVTPFGALKIVLSYKTDGVSMHLRPDDMRAALTYHAAQMVAGAELQDCEHCHKPFLSGGEARGHGKRRGDARFCSDECRYRYHNEVRRKKRKL